MKKITLFKLYVKDQDEALRFYVDKLGFKVVEDNRLGDYRWLLITAPGNHEFSVNLEIAKTDEEKRLVGRRAAAPRRGVRGRAEGHALRNGRDDAGFVRQQNLSQPKPRLTALILARHDFRSFVSCDRAGIQYR